MSDEPFRPVIRTQSDLLRVWRHLMEPLGFSGQSIWLMLIDAEDRPSPRITEIEDSVVPPGEEMLAGLADMLRHIAEEVPGSRWAFLRSRPGRARIGEIDRAWAEALHRACHLAELRCDVVHLATDDDLVPIPLDELGLRLAPTG